MTAPKPLMLIGPVGAGKSTLLKAMHLAGPSDEAAPVKKTEAIVYLDRAIDTPGEMVTIPHFYNALLLNSVRAGVVLFLMDGQRPSSLPSRLALAMKAPVVGVISKVDLAGPDTLARARRSLGEAGVKTIFEVSSVTGQGLKELNEWLAGFSAPASA